MFSRGQDTIPSYELLSLSPRTVSPSFELPFEGEHHKGIPPCAALLPKQFRQSSKSDRVHRPKRGRASQSKPQQLSDVRVLSARTGQLSASWQQLIQHISAQKPGLLLTGRTLTLSANSGLASMRSFRFAVNVFTD